MPEFAATSQPGPGRVGRAYERLVAQGALLSDDAQLAATAGLDAIGTALETLEAGRGGFAGLFQRRHKVPRGAYLWGDVGRGKTLLMDLFFDSVAVKAKRRVHFHEFMDEIHTAIAQFRAETNADKGRRDPIPAVVKPILRDVRLLCLDEFHVTDIANAMLLQRLFSTLFGAGLVVVATSNSAPDELYRDGLNRQLFLPFIDLLSAHTDVIELDAVKDYRRDKLAGQEMFHFGEGPQAQAAMNALFAHLAGGQMGELSYLTSLGRTLEVPAQALGVARFGFAQLCGTALGARDYLKVAHAFHTLIIDEVPVLGHTRRDAAMRFILLVDTLYDQGVHLGGSFATPLEELGSKARMAAEFARCRSRLHEMQSEDYLTRGRGAG